MKNLANFKIAVKTRECLVQAIYQMLINDESVSKVIHQFKDEHKAKKVDFKMFSLSLKSINKNKKKIEAMAKALLEFETIDSDQINDIMAGKKMRPPKPSRGSDTPKKPSGGNSGTSTVSPQPTAKS